MWWNQDSKQVLLHSIQHYVHKQETCQPPQLIPMFTPFLIAVFFVVIFGLGGSHQNSQGDLNSWCPSGPTLQWPDHRGKRVGVLVTTEFLHPLFTRNSQSRNVPLMMLLHFYIKYQQNIIWFYQVYSCREKWDKVQAELGAILFIIISRSIVWQWLFIFCFFFHVQV